MGTVPVQVVTAGGTSNATSLNVTDRVPNGRLNWRLRMEGPYSAVRPARGPDGTVYAIDVYSRLYAVSSDGALKWVARNAGNKGVAVGVELNGTVTIYTGSESDVKAFNPDGTLKWTFVQNPRAFILIGMSVGPDGNIYGVASSGMGVFSLAPDGTLRWANPEAYNRLIVDYAEIVFGLNNGRDQLYFYANNHTRAVRLDDGGSVFTISPTGQPVVSPLDGTMHAKASAYSPGGERLWQFIFPVSGVPVSDPDMGSDGTHYVVNRSFELYALNPNGTEKWNVTLPDYVGAPNVDPANSLLVLGSNNTLNNPGFVQAISTTSRKELWRVDLPAEETSVYNPWTGQFGFNQYVDTRARFSADGQTVYLITAIATGGLVTDRCFLYALSTGSTQTPPPTSTLLHSSSILLSARTTRTGVKVSGNVTVVDENNAAVPGATVYATWTLPGGSTQSQTATTDPKGVAKFSTSGGLGTYTLTITNIVKTGYTFDPSNSVPSKSITK